MIKHVCTNEQRMFEERFGLKLWIKGMIVGVVFDI